MERNHVKFRLWTPRRIHTHTGTKTHTQTKHTQYYVHECFHNNQQRSIPCGSLCCCWWRRKPSFQQREACQGWGKRPASKQNKLSQKKATCPSRCHAYLRTIEWWQGWDHQRKGLSVCMCVAYEVYIWIKYAHLHTYTQSALLWVRHVNTSMWRSSTSMRESPFQITPSQSKMKTSTESISLAAKWKILCYSPRCFQVGASSLKKITHTGGSGRQLLPNAGSYSAGHLDHWCPAAAQGGLSQGNGVIMQESGGLLHGSASESKGACRGAEGRHAGGCQSKQGGHGQHQVQALPGHLCWETIKGGRMWFLVGACAFCFCFSVSNVGGKVLQKPRTHKCFQAPRLGTAYSGGEAMSKFGQKQWAEFSAFKWEALCSCQVFETNTITGPGEYYLDEGQNSVQETSLLQSIPILHRKVS